MLSRDVLRYLHHLGSPITGIVIAQDEPNLSHGVLVGGLTLATKSAYQTILPYEHLVDYQSDFSLNVIPNVGKQIDAVVFNFLDNTLILSAKPRDLKEAAIRQWREYYDYIETLTIGSQISGIVERAKPYGLLVNIGSPFMGMIDIGHTAFNGGSSLPYDYAKWPQKGDRIRCNIGYFRLHDQQIGLGWLPKQVH